MVRPVPGSERGLAIANGWPPLGVRIRIAWVWRQSTNVRNLVCTGADPERIAILDNFVGQAVTTKCAWVNWSGLRSCYDGATARRAFISGKDSLNNQFRTEEGDVIRIPPTLLISGFAPVEAERFVTSMDAKSAGNVLMLVGVTTRSWWSTCHRTGRRNSAWRLRRNSSAGPSQAGPANAKAVARAIRTIGVCSAHDLSEGGLLVAAAEMGFAGRLGIELDLAVSPEMQHPW